MTKFSRLYKELVVPAGLLAALIIGAGMFALPSLFMQAGFLIGFLYLIIFGAVFAAIHVMYAQIINSNGEERGFVGYAEVHFGKLGFCVAALTTAVGLMLASTIYLVLSTPFIQLVWPGVGAETALLLFWFFGAAAVVGGIQRLASLEFWVMISMVAIMVLIFLFGVSSSHFSFAALPIADTSKAFLPYGAVLFAFGGRAAISSIRTYMRKEGIADEKLKRAIIVGTVVPGIAYALFTLGVVGLSANGVSEEAVSGLTGLSPLSLAAIGLLGVFSLWTSYVFLGFEAREIFSYDFKLPLWLSALATTFLPLILYVVGFNDFIALVSVAGGVFLALESIMVVLMWQKAKAKTALVGVFLILVFAFGAVYEVMRIL